MRPTFRPCHTKSINDVVREPERHALWCFQRFPLHSICQGLPRYEVTKTYLLEKAIEVNMYDIPCVRIHEDVFEMTVAETTIRGVNRLSPVIIDGCPTQG